MEALNQFLQTKFETQQLIPIYKGFSSDRKYKVTLKNGEVLLVRVSDKGLYKQKKNEYDILSSCYNLGVICSRPIDFQTLPTGEICMVLSYLQGSDGEESLPSYPEEIQYLMGLEAGKQLKQLHTIPAPSSHPNWYEQKWKKHMSYYEAYQTCGYSFDFADEIELYIEENAYLMKKRPSTLQHDDFHPSNIIIHEGRYNGVIDFNRYDWGDPYHDFYKVGLFTSNVSAPFAVGQLHGYFDGKITEDFWKLYSVYMGMSIFSSIVWSLRQNPSILDSMLGNLHSIVQDHKQFKSPIPVWYEVWASNLQHIEKQK